MAVSCSTPEDVVNVALRRLGARARVENMMDGSDQAKAALDLYGQTRDELMRQQDWGFAERTAYLSLLKTAPTVGGVPTYVLPTSWNPATNPPPPWIYEYAYPSDCLKVRTLKVVSGTLPNFDPQPNIYEIANDSNYSPPRKVILTNTGDAMCVYTGRVTDPATWEADFTEAVAASIARRLAVFVKDLNAERLEFNDEMLAFHRADMEQG